MKSWSFALAGIVLFISNSVNAALVSRLGGLAYYDTEADLTWLADANYAMTSGYDADGRMSWVDANTWAASLNVSGVTSWRLADTVDVNNNGQSYSNIYQGVDYGYNITTHSELSNMFYNVLGNSAYYDTNGRSTGCSTPPNFCLTNTGLFSNLKAGTFWSATRYIPDTTYAWTFNMSDGFQGYNVENGGGYAWAVHDGDVLVPPRCDLNNNGKVDAGDLSQVVRMIMAEIAIDLDCDLNNGGLGDGVISVADLVLVSRIALGIIPAIYN